MRLTRIIALGSLASLYLLPVACSDSSVDPNEFSRGGSGGKAGSAAGASSSEGGAAGTDPEGGEGGVAGTDPEGGAGSGTAGTISFTGGSGGGNTAGSGTASCVDNGTPDQDGDGWTVAEGDCNDCDPFVNPGAIDVVNYVKGEDGKPTDVPLSIEQQVDEDCDGKVVGEKDTLSCDAGLKFDDKDPTSAARAIGLCNVNVPEAPTDPKERRWGVLKAGYNKINTPFLNDKIDPKTSAGILDVFGDSSNPIEGSRLFALSSGAARVPGQSGYQSCDSGGVGSFDGYPPGFPVAGTCPGQGTPFDGVALDLVIRAPTNARSLKFKFRFYSCEYPVYTCKKFNDVFAVLMAPNPLPASHPLSKTSDIAFDSSNNVIGVNNQAFFNVCEPSNTYDDFGEETNTPNGYTGCKSGSSKELEGTGFEGHGASAWLSTQVPVPPPSGKQAAVIKLRFAIWDSADGILNSTALIDDFQWSAEEGSNIPVTVIDPPPDID